MADVAALQAKIKEAGDKVKRRKVGPDDHEGVRGREVDHLRAGEEDGVLHVRFCMVAETGEGINSKLARRGKARGRGFGPHGRRVGTRLSHRSR